MVSDKITIKTLKNFMPMEYWDIIDWITIVQRKKEVEQGIWCYDCHFIKLYFTDNMKPVTYGKQKVIDDKVYYDMNDSTIGAGTLTYLGDICYYD